LCALPLDCAPRTFSRSQLAPLSRHSALPELRRFVDAFRPSSIVPNTIYDTRNLIDYFALPRLFNGVLGPGADERIQREARAELEDRRVRRGECRGYVAPRLPPLTVGDASTGAVLNDDAIDALLEQGETADHLRGMFAHLDGPPELATAVEVNLGLKDVEDMHATALDSLRQLVVGGRERMPAALQGEQPDRRKRAVTSRAPPAPPEQGLRGMPPDSIEARRRAAEREGVMPPPATHMMKAQGRRGGQVAAMRPKSPVKPVSLAPDPASRHGRPASAALVTRADRSPSLAKAPTRPPSSSASRRSNFTFELHGETQGPASPPPQQPMRSTALSPISTPAPSLALADPSSDLVNYLKLDALPNSHPAETRRKKRQRTMDDDPSLALLARSAQLNKDDFHLSDDRLATMTPEQRARIVSNVCRGVFTVLRGHERARVAELAAAVRSGATEPKLAAVESQASA
jgi:hypothetical protein